MRHEYLFRVGSVIALLFAGVGFVLTVALIPTYLLIGVQTTEIENEIARNGDSKEALKNAETLTKETTELIAQLKRASSTVSMSSLIQEVERLASPEIEFKNFSVDSTKGAVLKMNVQGEAPTRELLVRFKTALESSEKFLKVEIPITDLVRNVDVPFAITVTVAKKE